MKDRAGSFHHVNGLDADLPMSLDIMCFALWKQHPVHVFASQAMPESTAACY
jgi:hypothetical protein